MNLLLVQLDNRCENIYIYKNNINLDKIICLLKDFIYIVYVHTNDGIVQMHANILRC